MNRSTSLSVPALVAILIIAMVPTPADAIDPSDAIEMQPLGPDTGRFWFHIADGIFCQISVRDNTSGTIDNPTIYATNTKDDACALAEDDGAAHLISTTNATRRVQIALGVDQTVELVAGEPIGATIWTWAENVGQVYPVFTLTAGDGPGRLHRIVDTLPDETVPAGFTEMAVGDRTWQRHDVDFGLAPASFPSGPVILSATMTNDDEIRRVGAVRTGLGLAVDHKSFLDLPLAEQVDEPDPEPPEEPPAPWPPAIEMQPLGPDAGRFWFHIADGVYCEISVRDNTSGAIDNPTIYATNTKDDACARDADDGASHALITTNGMRVGIANNATRRVDIALGVDQTVELVAGAPIRATIWSWAENVGQVYPVFTLSAGDGPGRLHRIVDTLPDDTVPAGFTEVAVGDRTWQRHDVDFGLAPASFPSGAVVLSATMTNDDEIRDVGAVRTGLGLAGDHKSFLDLPLAEQVDEPDPEPPEEPPMPWPPAIETAGVRPGVQHVTSGVQCTTNFVFRDRTTDTLYMGTAAHCVDDVPRGGHSTISSSNGPSIRATVAFSTRHQGGYSNADYALLEIPADDLHKVHPAVRHFGGPIALANPAAIQTLDKVITYGNSSLRPGPGVEDQHEGYVTGKSEWYTGVHTITPGIPGDSGSGIMTADGKAIGALSTMAISPITGQNKFSNAKPVIDRMNERGWDLELVTWELLDPGLAPAPFG